jgi:outer membrane lipoprotein-sorting protein
MKIHRTIIALCLLLASCETEHIATYPPTSAQDATKILVDRSRSIKNISAQGLITLQKPNGETVRLDAAMAIQRPGNARLRAWKFGQAVFDITLTPLGLWVVAPQHDPNTFGDKTANVTRQWLKLMTGTFDDQSLIVDDRGSHLICKQQTEDGSTLLCEVDRKTLTARRYILRDPDGEDRFALTLSRYAEFNGIAWPRRIEAVSPTGRIVVDLHDVDINGELPASAFHPPARAVKILETQP